MAKTYRKETRTKINKIFEVCEARASSRNCRTKCSKCGISNAYETISGVRLEDIDNDL